MASAQILNNSFSTTQSNMKQVVHSSNNIRLVVGLLVVALFAVLLSMLILLTSSIGNHGINDINSLKADTVNRVSTVNR